MATIYRNLVGRGYFPKELPPAFFTDDFARYATSIPGREALGSYKPPDNFTEVVRHRLAVAGQGGIASRSLTLPHPWAYSALARVVAKHFRRLLKKSGASKFSKSRPIYAENQPRALRTMIKPSNLSRERVSSRAGATHLLKLDVSQFYPALYTHAVGWAIDPRLRQRKHWNDKKMLGKQVDQLLMNMQGKVSQGIPIGNDISFLLAEAVLAQIDKALKVAPERTYRWYDDYEIACAGRQDAEEVLVRLNSLLDSFRLRANPLKTKIIELPESSGDGWQDELHDLSTRAIKTAANMVSYFDHAFQLRTSHPDRAILLYAIGTLFKESSPKPYVREIAESCITQGLLAEPGCAQKAFALLTFWELNGSQFDRSLMASTIDRLVEFHEARGVSSDISWALAFCIQHGLPLSKRSGRTLSRVDDDAVAIQALHAHSLGLLPGFKPSSVQRTLANSTCDGDHWLLLYESVRQGFIPALLPTVSGNKLFGDFLAKGVTFYRMNLPPYSQVVHPGGAPGWVVTSWLKPTKAKLPGPFDQPAAFFQLLDKDAALLLTEGKEPSDILRELFDRLNEYETAGLEPYAP